MAKKSIKIKTAPNSKESEMMVLGSCLSSINSLNISAETLDENDFYYIEHKKIFKVLKEAYKKDKPADIHLVAEELKRQDFLDDIGGVGYLTTLAQYAGTSAFIEEYVQIVKDKATLRKMLDAAEVIEKNILEEPEDVKTALDDAQNLFFQISQNINYHQHLLIKDILSGLRAESQIPYLKELQKRQEEFLQKGPNDPKITGIPTCFIDLDKLINGFDKSNLMILAARPAMGKTALALNIAENICYKNNLPVGIFSLEMTAEQIVHRIICSQSEVESEKIKTGFLNGNEYQKIVATVNYIQEKLMIIDDHPSLKITDLKARARRMKEAFNIGFLVIDYLQLLSGSGTLRSLENRQNEISEISRTLKNLARELNIPILCLSQLSRKVEERQGHRPMMSDLRESGCLSEDTLIKDANTGKLYTIKQLANRKDKKPIYVLGIGQDLKLKKRKLIKAFYSGKKQLFKLTTLTGREIKASANHPFLTINGWVNLENLKIKDRIALARNHFVENNKNPLSHDEIILLAHLLKKDTNISTKPYHYKSKNLKNIKQVQKSIKNIFKTEGKIIKKNKLYHYYFNPYLNIKNNKNNLLDWLDHHLNKKNSSEKIIFEKVFECDKKNRQLFLKHLWETQGSVIQKKSLIKISYSTQSYPLSHQIQHLLLSIGIQSKLKKINSTKKTMYHITVDNPLEQEKFLVSIANADKKTKDLIQFLYHLKKIKENNEDVIPKDAWNIINKSLENKSLDLLSSKLNLSQSISASDIPREKMVKINDLLKDQNINNLATSDIFWDEIKNIEKLQIEDVYDATIEEIHNFVANDIIVHNSLEQDSDLVFFLLRREYYDPYDKPGQAELIVAKNRHGAVGSVNLSFRKDIARFENFIPIDSAIDTNEEAFADFSPDN